MSRDTAIAHTHALEKGWWPGTEARDPNPTLDGVTQRAYDTYRDAVGLPHQTVRAMLPVERVAIYNTYWEASHAADLPEGVDALHFAYAFNAGPQAAVEILQSVLGVKQDGQYGPKTQAAVGASLTRPARLFYLLAFAQLAEYRRMIASPRLAPNARSWLQRLIVAHETFVPVLFP